METKRMKYNPSFLDDNELIETFVVRQAYLKLVMGTVRKNTHDTNQHLLIIGPRGSGKTTLVRRAAAEVRRDPEYNEQWYPLLFGEESYEVASAGQFWLEAIHHLSNQEKGSVWASVYEELRREMDEERLRIMALGKLMDFADEQGKRILLVVENLNQILGEQVDDRDGWKLRETLMNEPRIMLLGSATNRFDAIDNSKMAMYEQFKTLELEPLNEKECKTIWEMVTDNEISENEARAVRILTGGSPRLLTILSSFGKDKSFQTLMEDLTYLVDDHTDYFKSNIESLPTLERKVFVCLASLWEESSAKEVAEAARITTSKASALLKRLEVRGIVTSSPPKGRKKYYQLAERLYNIYYLMRRGQNSGRVKAVVRFMIGFYGEGRLHEAAADIAHEICKIDRQKRECHFLALREIISWPCSDGVQDRIISALPEELFKQDELPEYLKVLIERQDQSDLAIPMSQGLEDFIDAFQKGDFAEAKRKALEEVNTNPNDDSWSAYGIALRELGDIHAANSAFEKATKANPDNPYLWKLLASTQQKSNVFDLAATSLQKAIELDPNDYSTWMDLGYVYINITNYIEAESSFLNAIELNDQEPEAWGILGKTLILLHREEEAITALEKSLILNPNDSTDLCNLAIAHMFLEHYEKSETTFRKSLELDPNFAPALFMLGKLMSWKNKHKEAAQLTQNALTNDIDFVWACSSLDRQMYSFVSALKHEDNAKALLERIPHYLSKVELIERITPIATDIMSALAAIGHEHIIIDIVTDSPSADIFEPLIAGIKLYLGEEIKAPQEVKEIATDVVKRIEEWEGLIEKAKAETEVE